MKIIICGRKGSGKDSVADYLKSKYGGISISFAEPLYDMMYFCQDRLGIPRHKDRKFLTTMGDHFRELDSNVFIDTCINEANTFKYNNIYIPDGRYFNELDAGRDNGFFLINIIASDENRQKRRPNESIIDSHSSENGYPDNYKFDITISNDSTLEDLYKVLDLFIETVVLKTRRINAV